MNLDFYIARLGENRGVFESLLRGVSVEQARWKPAPEKWSMLEVVNHLYDEEREDFRQHLDFLLHRPGDEWPKIDPQGWVVSRAYNERELGESLANFLREREQSLAWLRTLRAPDWENSRERSWGTINAGEMLASWLAHDFLHIKQLARLHYDYVAEVSAPRKIVYAGEW
jgi:hypothetical protein